jgi:hypothetical protein
VRGPGFDPSTKKEKTKNKKKATSESVWFHFFIENRSTEKSSDLSKITQKASSMVEFK